MSSVRSDRESRRVPVVHGRLPKGLSGYFLRNGPDVKHEPLVEDVHWFDGDGFVHWVRLHAADESEEDEENEGEIAEYGGSYVSTQGFLEEKEKGKALYCGIKQSPILPFIMQGFKSKFGNGFRPDRPYWVIQQKNTANNGLECTPSGRLLATYEAGSPYEIKLVRGREGKTRLETVGIFTPKPKKIKRNDSSSSSTLSPSSSSSSSSPSSSSFLQPKFNHWLHNFTAHSKTCPLTEELIFISYDLIGSKFHVGVLGKDGDELLSMETFEYATGEACMMHDFAITESKIIIMSHPLLFNLKQSMKGGLPFTYSTTCPSYFGVIDRKGKRRRRKERKKNKTLFDSSKAEADHGKIEIEIEREDRGGCGREIRWIEAENGYCYHSMAAFDDPTDAEVVHLYAQKLEATGALGMATFEENGKPLVDFDVQELAQLHKWTLKTSGCRGKANSRNRDRDRSGMVLESRRECDVYSDFPEVNPEYVGRKCRFGYSMQISDAHDAGGGVPVFDKLLKHDFDHPGTYEVLDLNDHHLSPSSSSSSGMRKGKVGGDLCFVPDKNRSDQEDGGWILFFTHSLDSETETETEKETEKEENPPSPVCWLEVVDAQNITAGPVAMVELPFIPIGFHATWVPDHFVKDESKDESKDRAGQGRAGQGRASVNSCKL